MAQTAANAAKPYVRPQMLAEGSDMLYLKQVRHPCIELNKEFVANDCSFKREKEIFQVITGKLISIRIHHALLFGIKFEDI